MQHGHFTKGRCKARMTRLTRPVEQRFVRSLGYNSSLCESIRHTTNRRRISREADCGTVHCFRCFDAGIVGFRSGSITTLLRWI